MQGVAMFFAMTAIVFGANAGAFAATVKVSVTAGNKPLDGAVVTAESPDGKPLLPLPGSDLTAVMDQRDRHFVPHVLAVELGTAVSFPNSDNIRHDVYSFSPAKTFELPLYKGTPAKPVLFDKPGVVVLGCNIHDWMLGFIDVVPTPYFAKTDDTGVAPIKNVPPGSYTLRVWAPRVKGRRHAVTRRIRVGNDDLSLHFDVTLGPQRAHVHRRPEQEDSAILKRLERKFGRFRQEPPN
jgi:plastocyanin